MNGIKEQVNTFFGRRFEDICKDFLIELNEKNKLPFQLEYLSNWWGTARENEERKEIEVDGGINQKTIKTLKKAGVNLFAVGSYLQKSRDVKRDWNELERRVKKR